MFVARGVAFGSPGLVHHGRISPAVSRGLGVLSERIKAAKVPSSKLDETLTIATWNIREFGRRRRLDASLHYIAEIIGQFDIVSIVELREDVSDLEIVLRYLGPYWRVVFSDYITDAGGNRERIGYVYDTRAAVFTGLASHATATRTRVGDEWTTEIDWWRPPYMASFAAGSFELVLLAAHVRWGKAGEKGRVEEVARLADWVVERAGGGGRGGKSGKTKGFGGRDLLVVGDFNIPSLRGAMYKAVSARGLLMPKGLAGVTGSNLARNKRYDQILHLPGWEGAFTGLGGVVDFYGGDFEGLYDGVDGVGKKGLDLMGFTFQISDHLPLWVQICTDGGGAS